MIRVTIKIRKELLEAINRTVKGISQSHRLLICLRIGLYKHIGYTVSPAYIKLEDLLQDVNSVLRIDYGNYRYDPPICPSCKGILTQQSDTIQCLKCGKEYGKTL